MSLLALGAQQRGDAGVVTLQPEGKHGRQCAAAAGPAVASARRPTCRSWRRVGQVAGWRPQPQRPLSEHACAASGSGSSSSSSQTAVGSLAEATCMEEQFDWLAAHALQLAQGSRTAGAGRVLIGIAGGPGSGKSTTAREVCRRINAAAGEELAVVVPMDGFHYYRAQLQQFEDPAAAFARRGAHWTFDAAAFVDCIRRIREQGGALVPSFDHGVGDPVEDDTAVTPAHRIVLAEGNYLLLDIEPWAQLTGLFDETWFVECNIDAAMERVYARQTGHGVAPEVSRGRIAGNDRPNAELIATTRGRASRVVPSVPFAGVLPESESDFES